MDDLFFSDGALESGKNSPNGVEGVTKLKLVFDLHHNGHDGSLFAVVDGWFSVD